MAGCRWTSPSGACPAPTTGWPASTSAAWMPTALHSTTTGRGSSFRPSSTRARKPSTCSAARPSGTGGTCISTSGATTSSGGCCHSPGTAATDRKPRPRSARHTSQQPETFRGETSMKRSQASVRRAALSIALGACLSAMAPAVMAQSATGSVAGRATAGEQVQLVSATTGATRTVTVGADGSYRIGQLQVGDYSVQLLRDGRPVGEPVAISVGLGGTTTVNLGSAGGVADLAAVTVVGNRVVNRVDVRSTESATTITREEWARLPVEQSLSSVALLAPGVVAGNASFGGLSFGGSSVAENAVFVNGLNVTDVYERQG